MKLMVIAANGKIGRPDFVEVYSDEPIEDCQIFICDRHTDLDLYRANKVISGQLGMKLIYRETT
jgi:hypothetical protein